MRSRNLALALAVSAVLAAPSPKADAGEMEWFGAIYAKFLDGSNRHERALYNTAEGDPSEKGGDQGQGIEFESQSLGESPVVSPDEVRKLAGGLYAGHHLQGRFHAGPFKFPLHHEKGSALKRNKEKGVLSGAGKIKIVHLLHDEKGVDTALGHRCPEPSETVLDFSDELISVRVEGAGKNAEIHYPIAYYYPWRAYREGRPIEITTRPVLANTHELLMSVAAADGVTDLRYERPMRERVAMWTGFILWISVLLLSVVLLAGKRMGAKR